MSKTYADLAAHLKRTSHLESIEALVGWDQETYMPPGAGEARAAQIGLLTELVHARQTSEELGTLLEAAEADPETKGDSELAASVREVRRDRDKAMKLPTELVVELAETGSRAQEVWREARSQNDFAMFAPMLEKMVALARRKAACLKDDTHDVEYDALVDEYEPGMTSAQIAEVFTPLGEELAALLRELRQGRHPGVEPITRSIPIEQQRAFGEFVLDSLGFDRNAGRLDVTTHPFCSGIAAGDTRLTTRYTENRFAEALYGTIHECGHGLYEQGLRKQERMGEPLAEDAGTGIHESQSRLWENLVCGNLAFWEWAAPHARRLMPAIGGVDAEEIYRAINSAEPGFIRVEADEGTYNGHVFVRFELERALFDGSLAVQDLPGVWNEAYKRHLGLDVPDDRRGVLQDVHWSFGLFGYFPTYTLGNLYSCQLWEALDRDLGDLDGAMRRGEFGGILGWLRENIHRHGRRYRGPELCERVTGERLSYQPLLRHLRSRLLPIYGV